MGRIIKSIHTSKQFKMSIGYWILAGVGAFSFLLIISAIWPTLGEIIMDILSEVVDNLGDD